MTKSDKSIKHITLQSIKRATIKPIDYPLSRIYEDDEQIESENIRTEVNLQTGEELICSTIISEDIWTVLTTRRIITREGIKLVEHSLTGFVRREMGDFKDRSGQAYIKGILLFDDGQLIPYFIETRKGSMIMIYGVQTATQINRRR
jgi:hypothetical protein